MIRRGAVLFLFITFVLLGAVVVWILRNLQDDTIWLDEYRNCLGDSLNSISTASYWSELVNIVALCQKRHHQNGSFNLKAYSNLDEVKYARSLVRNLKDDENCTVVTLGIGKDVYAEEKLKKVFPRKCRFFGIDPTEETNRKLYESIGGNYYKGAIAATNGIQNASVLTEKSSYQRLEIDHIDFKTYLLEHVGQKVIDLLLIDIEGSEFDLLPLLSYGSELDVTEVTICQINVEFHFPDEKKLELFNNFVSNNIRNNRFVYMNPVPLGNSMLRLYMMNIRDEVCKSRYAGTPTSFA